MVEIVFYTDGQGHWTKREYAKQCPETILMDECQGVAGHEGNHWCYSSNGSYNWELNEEDSKNLGDMNTVGGSTPPRF